MLTSQKSCVALWFALAVHESRRSSVPGARATRRSCSRSARPAADVSSGVVPVRGLGLRRAASGCRASRRGRSGSTKACTYGPLERRRSGRSQPARRRHARLGRRRRGFDANTLCRRRSRTRLTAAHDRAARGVDDRVVDLASSRPARARASRAGRRPPSGRAPATALPPSRERRRPLGAAARGATARRAAARPPRRRRAAAHGRLGRRRASRSGSGRAASAQQPAGGGRRPPAAACRARRDPAVALLPGELLRAAGPRARCGRAAAASRSPRVEAEARRVVAHVAERDRRPRSRAATGEEAVELRDRTRRAGARLAA